MPKTNPVMPDLLPLLARGKHRNPRKGACFMELASYLAGERWSDHPQCTHPLLAALARSVNDHTSDAARSRLAELIPSVIGLTSDDVRVDARVALLCATTALPVASAERQRVMAVSVLASERVLAELENRPGAELGEAGRSAFAQVPDAARWASRFARQTRTSPQAFRQHGAPHIVGYAVQGIAEACIPAPDDMLRNLLADGIDLARGLVRNRASERSADSLDMAFDAAEWEAACRLTGVTSSR